MSSMVYPKIFRILLALLYFVPFTSAAIYRTGGTSISSIPGTIPTRCSNFTESPYTDPNPQDPSHPCYFGQKISTKDPSRTCDNLKTGSLTERVYMCECMSQDEAISANSVPRLAFMGGGGAALALGLLFMLIFKKTLKKNEYIFTCKNMTWLLFHSSLICTGIALLIIGGLKPLDAYAITCGQ